MKRPVIQGRAQHLHLKGCRLATKDAAKSSIREWELEGGSQESMDHSSASTLRRTRGSAEKRNPLRRDRLLHGGLALVSVLVLERHGQWRCFLHNVETRKAKLIVRSKHTASANRLQVASKSNVVCCCSMMHVVC